MENNEIQLIESTSVSVFEAQERAQIDIQIATAKNYPRKIDKVRDNSIAIVIMDVETARACRYTKPVDTNTGKTISGESVHLARILAQQYGNIRVQQRIKEISEKTIVAEAVAFDLETNYAVSVEARRSIWSSKTNRRFSDSVIETNAMAILAIAERNAILKVIPKSITNVVYNAAFNAANGDLSDEQKIIKAREKAIAYFREKYEATDEEICKAAGVRSISGIKADEIANLRGFQQSLKDGEITPDELFGRKKEKSFDPATEKIEANSEKLAL